MHLLFNAFCKNELLSGEASAERGKIANNTGPQEGPTWRKYDKKGQFLHCVCTITKHKQLFPHFDHPVPTAREHHRWF